MIANIFVYRSIDDVYTGINKCYLYKSYMYKFFLNNFLRGVCGEGEGVMNSLRNSDKSSMYTKWGETFEISNFI